MINKLPIRIRLVFMNVSILVLCCVGLTVITNYSAIQMASQIAEVVTPAHLVPSTPYMGENTLESQQKTTSLPAYLTNIENQEKIINNYYKTSHLYMLFIIIIGGISTYFASKKVLHPLAKLNEKIKTSSIANLSDKIEVPDTKDEIAEISSSFNKMTDRIQDAFLFQQQFSANVAHELRTPLTILKTKIEVFNKKERQSITEYQQLITNLKEQILRLSDIIQTLLYLTNIDTVQEKEYISISDIIDSVLSDLSNISKQRNIHFSTDFNDVEIYGNIDLLYQVFYNIIQNSIKYNIDHGSVFVSVEKNNEKSIIKICDTGIGIPEEQKNQVFEPFFRVDKSRSRLMGGAGLGLSIVKNIIDKHNGTIHISDNKPNGTCFTVELPFIK